MKCIRMIVVIATVAASLGDVAIALTAQTSKAAPAGKTGGKRPGGTPGRVTGDVTTVTATSISVKTKDGERTFAVDTKTKVQTGTKSAPKSMPVTDVVKSGDRVTVAYQDAGASARAASIRIETKRGSL